MCAINITCIALTFAKTTAWTLTWCTDQSSSRLNVLLLLNNHFDPRMIVFAWCLFVIVSFLVASNQAFLSAPLSGMRFWRSFGVFNIMYHNKMYLRIDGTNTRSYDSLCKFFPPEITILSVNLRINDNYNCDGMNISNFSGFLIYPSKAWISFARSSVTFGNNLFRVLTP